MMWHQEGSDSNFTILYNPKRRAVRKNELHGSSFIRDIRIMTIGRDYRATGVLAL